MNKTLSKVLFTLAVVAFLMGPFIRTGTEMERYVQDEIAETRAAMGDRVGDWVVGFADSVFHNTPLNFTAKQAKKLQHTKEELELGERATGLFGKVLGDFSNSYLQGIAQQSYIMAMRLAIVLIWLAVLLPLFVAGAIDGFQHRNIKRAEFGSLRPATFTLAASMVTMVVGLPLLYLVLPFSMSPLLAPAWAAAVVIPLSVLISNSQPFFGR